MPTLDPIVVNPPKEKKTYTFSDNDIKEISREVAQQEIAKIPPSGTKLYLHYIIADCQYLSIGGQTATKINLPLISPIGLSFATNKDDITNAPKILNTDYRIGNSTYRGKITVNTVGEVMINFIRIENSSGTSINIDFQIWTNCGTANRFDFIANGYTKLSNISDTVTEL